MKRSVKGWLLAAAALVVLGGALFVGVMAALHWDFSKLSTEIYESNRYDITEVYHSISIQTDTADIRLVPSDEGTFVECYEQSNAKHTAAVKDGTLVIGIADRRQWYEHIGIQFGSPTVTVFLPQGAYSALSVTSDTGDVEIAKEFCFERIEIAEDTGDVVNSACATESVRIRTTTGDICVENVVAGGMELSVNSGDVTLRDVKCEGDLAITVSTGTAKLSNVTCQSLVSGGDTGDLFLQNVVAAKLFSITRSTGDVRFDGSDAAEILVSTDTGDVEGRLLTDKVFITETDTGDVRVPHSVTGGRCEITTDTGDIHITIG